jgi:hypothetical protein
LASARPRAAEEKDINDMTPPTAAFTVWFRRDQHRRWEKIGTADTEAEAWRVALAHPLSGDKTIARGGEDINAGKRR